jgi:hypothetical protein
MHYQEKYEDKNRTNHEKAERYFVYYFLPPRLRKCLAGVRLRMRTCFSVGDWSTEVC